MPNHCTITESNCLSNYTLKYHVVKLIAKAANETACITVWMGYHQPTELWVVFTAPLTSAKPALTKADGSGLRGCTPTYPHKIALIGRTVKFAGFHKKRVRNSPAKSSCGSGPYAELISMKTSVGSLQWGQPQVGIWGVADPGLSRWITARRPSRASWQCDIRVMWVTGFSDGAAREHGGCYRGSLRLRIISLDRLRKDCLKFLEILLCLTLLQTRVIKQSKRKPKSQTKISLWAGVRIHPGGLLLGGSCLPVDTVCSK